MMKMKGQLAEIIIFIIFFVALNKISFIFQLINIFSSEIGWYLL